jgi:hypothetical protein
MTLNTLLMMLHRLTIMIIFLGIAFTNMKSSHLYTECGRLPENPMQLAIVLDRFFNLRILIGNSFCSNIL